MINYFSTLEKWYEKKSKCLDKHISKQWLSDEWFRGWLKQKSTKDAMCGYCFNKVINIADMGESALKSHAKSVEHQMRSPKPSTVPVTSPRTDNMSPTMSMSATTMSNVPTTSSTATSSTSLLQTRIVDTLIKDGQFLELLAVINVGTCGLHTVHGSLKAGVKEADWKVGKVLQAMHFLLHDFPSRQDTYIQYTETNVMPLPYCGHRRCENEKSCERAALIWDSYCKYIKYCLTSCKSKHPQGKRFDCLVLALKNPLMKAKFKLVEYVLMKLNCFLCGFETVKPMIPFLYGILTDIVNSLLQMFVKKEICDKTNTLQKLLNLDLSDVNIRKKVPR